MKYYQVQQGLSQGIIRITINQPAIIMECHVRVLLPLLNWLPIFHFFPQAMEKVTVTYVTGDGGSLLKPRLVLQLHRDETSLAQVSAKLCDTCLEILGAEVPREDQNYSEILQEIHSKELCKNEDFTALGTLKGVQWVGLGSNLKTRNRVCVCVCVFLCRMLPMPVDRDVLSVLRIGRRKHLDESGLALAGTGSRGNKAWSSHGLAKSSKPTNHQCIAFRDLDLAQLQIGKLAFLMMRSHNVIDMAALSV